MSYKSVDPGGARELLHSDSEFVVVDVRTPEEFEQGHIPGSYNVPIAFAGILGMSPNPAFVDVIQRLFGTEQKIVFA